MNNFKKEGFRKGNGGFGGKPRFGGGSKFGGHSNDRAGGNFGPREDRELFKAKCSACFQMCEVPFRPTNGKPVFCKDCFRDNAPSDRAPRHESHGGGFRNDSRPPRDERPRHDERAPRVEGNDDMKKQLTNLESKVDYLIELLKKQAAPKASTPVVALKAVETKSEAKPKAKAEVITEEAPKKERKPKTEKVKAPAKKAAKKEVKKKAK
jgi:CxxC-x17-CxxC domain-containing protein